MKPTFDLPDEKRPFDWRPYHQARWTALAAISVFFISAIFLDSLRPVLMQSALIALLVLSIVGYIRYAWWSCPRCHQRFHGVIQSLSIFFEMQCKQCGLKIGDQDPRNWIPE